jgi:hypothetical protein
MRHKNKFIKIILIVLGIPAFILLFGFGVMHLWNWLIPAIFNGPIITFWQAIGLFILSKILFGGFGKHHGGQSRNMRWKEKMKERMSNMTPEEKELFKQRFKDKCRSNYWNDEPKQENNTL